MQAPEQSGAARIGETVPGAVAVAGGTAARCGVVGAAFAACKLLSMRPHKLAKGSSGSASAVSGSKRSSHNCTAARKAASIGKRCSTSRLRAADKVPNTYSLASSSRISKSLFMPCTPAARPCRVLSRPSRCPAAFGCARRFRHARNRRHRHTKYTCGAQAPAATDSH